MGFGFTAFADSIRNRVFPIWREHLWVFYIYTWMVAIVEICHEAATGQLVLYSFYSLIWNRYVFLLLPAFCDTL